MKTAVVILNWNGRKLLEQFLPSVVKFSSEASVYVADNNSDDDSVDFLSENFPSVKIIQNSTNGGYAKGYNDALSTLSEDIFVLLNSDVEVTKNWLNPIISEFKKDELLVAAQPKILDYKNKDYFEYAGAAGGYIDKFGYPYCRGRIFNSIEKDVGQYNDTVKIFWATGACLFVRKDTFRMVGGFDEDFFTHQEEIDFCWRLQASGGLIKYIGASSIYHLGAATLASQNPKKTFYNFRNCLLLLLKNAGGSRIWGILFIRLLLDGVAVIRFMFQGKITHCFSVLKAHLSFYQLLPKYLNKRKLQSSNYKYFTVKSIVWEYFVNNNRTFKDL
jgi:GT2 family glycosyltransferase